MPALAGTRPRDGARPQAQRLSRSSRSSRTGANSWGWPARVGAQEVGLPRVRVDADGGGERHRVEGAGEVNGQDAHPATGSGIVSLAPLLRRMGMPRSKAWLWLGLSLYVAAMAAGLATDTDDFKALAVLGVVLLWCGLLADDTALQRCAGVACLGSGLGRPRPSRPAGRAIRSSPRRPTVIRVSGVQGRARAGHDPAPSSPKRLATTARASG